LNFIPVGKETNIRVIKKRKKLKDKLILGLNQFYSSTIFELQNLQKILIEINFEFMNNFRLLSSLLIFFLAIFCQTELALTQTTSQGRSVFKIVTSPTTFKTSSDIIHFKPSSYTGSPWNLVMSDGNVYSKVIY